MFKKAIGESKPKLVTTAEEPKQQKKVSAILNFRKTFKTKINANKKSILA